MVYLKVAKRRNPKISHHKENNIFFLFSLCDSEVIDVN